MSLSLPKPFGSILGREPEEPGAMPADPMDEFLEMIFELIKNRRRRHVVEEVAALGEDEWITIKDLSTTIAAFENDVQPDELTPSQRKPVYVGLYQTHLGRLSEAGLIAYDDRSNKVRRTPATEIAIDAWRAARREVPAIKEMEAGR